MSGLRSGILRAGLDALHFTRAHRLLEPYARGAGLIFMLHQVCRAPRRGFAPNRILSIDPDFLEAVIGQVRGAGLDIISLDEMRRRLVAREDGRRFAVFTLDDGYRDTLTLAYPIFKRHGIPFTVYVAGTFPDGKGELWWLALEEIIASGGSIEVDLGAGRAMFSAKTVAEKNSTFDWIYWRLRAMDEDRQRAVIHDLCARYRFDLAAHCRELIMNWKELAALAKDPLATIGAHTAGHHALAKLPAAAARREIEQGADRLEAKLGFRPRHLSYPYGDQSSAGPREFELARELGFDTAVTTRKGMIFPGHVDRLTALPRVSLNGEYQALKYTELYLSGAPFTLWNGLGLGRLDAA